MKKNRFFLIMMLCTIFAFSTVVYASEEEILDKESKEFIQYLEENGYRITVELLLTSTDTTVYERKILPEEVYIVLSRDGKIYFNCGRLVIVDWEQEAEMRGFDGNRNEFLSEYPPKLKENASDEEYATWVNVVVTNYLYLLTPLQQETMETLWVKSIKRALHEILLEALVIVVVLIVLFSYFKNRRNKKDLSKFIDANAKSIEKLLKEKNKEN